MGDTFSDTFFDFPGPRHFTHGGRSRFVTHQPHGRTGSLLHGERPRSSDSAPALIYGPDSGANSGFSRTNRRSHSRYSAWLMVSLPARSKASYSSTV